MGLSRTVFETEQYLQNFHTPCTFNAPAEGFPWNSVTPKGLKKLE